MNWAQVMPTYFQPSPKNKTYKTWQIYTIHTPLFNRYTSVIILYINGGIVLGFICFHQVLNEQEHY